ncbi:lysosome membrane protein 2-like [Montipora capricornis]|uniref:lysosome membrane protein 2-like n=1 Tax=Montipora capricornis TaxID=246305 RepID=UPI0035F20277
MSSNRCCGCCSRKSLTCFFALSGIVLLILGLTFNIGEVLQKWIQKNIDEEVQLKADSLAFKEWKNTSVPVYMKVFVFNVTNPDEVMKGESIPNVTQIGPYSYRELRSNEVLDWNSDKSVVTFMPNRTYVFDTETSCAGCDDQIDSFVTVNIPLLAVALKVKNTNLTNYPNCLKLLQFTATGWNVKLFQRKNVHELIWGYTDVLLGTLVSFKTKECPSSATEGASSFVQLQYNNTYYGISAVNTGQDDIQKVGQFTMWRNQRHLTWWSDQFANMINGTDGTQFAPSIKREDALYVFSPDICRSMSFKYESTVRFKQIELFRFLMPRDALKSGDIYPPNKGFCVAPGCLPSGLMNISLCKPMNPPVVISGPHFYQGNESLLKTVNGLHPMKSAHETYLDVEPLTGIVMRAVKRVQVNVALESVDTLTETTGKFKSVFLPVLFLEESAEITDEKAEEFRNNVYKSLIICKVVEYFLIATGLLCLLAAFVLLFVIISCDENGTRQDKQPLIAKQSKKGTRQEKQPLIAKSKE